MPTSPGPLLQWNNPAKGSFEDVATNTWYYSYVETAAKAGIVTGYKGNFTPDLPINREEIVAMVVRAMGLSQDAASLTGEELAKLLPYKDSGKISDWAVKSIAMAGKKGIVKGVSADSFAPLENATRAQAAVMLKRMLSSQGKL